MKCYMVFIPLVQGSFLVICSLSDCKQMIPKKRAPDTNKYFTTWLYNFISKTRLKHK